MTEEGRDAQALERLLSPDATPRVESAPGDDAARWLTADAWRLFARPRTSDAPKGEEIERFSLPDGRSLSAVFDGSAGAAWVPFDLEEAYRNYVSEGWRAGVRSRALSSRQLRAYYALKPLIPRSLQLAARRMLARKTALPSFPAWPLDESVALLLRFYAHCVLLGLGAENARFRWFWPKNYRAAAILTHDVESSAGLRLSIELAGREEERGLRSCFNVVASWYPIDHGILRELRDRGFEIGLHGLRHDHSLFDSRRSFESQKDALAEAAKSLGASGFRSPSTHRVYEWLGELPVLYDCSVPHSDPYEPQPGGCCTLWPYLIGDVVELPYTLPQDHTLFTLLADRSIERWVTQLEAIEGRFGLIQCLSHPDPGYLGDADKLALYTDFLDLLAERSDLWKPLPRDVATWWWRRDRADPADGDVSWGRFARGADGPYAAFEPPADTASAGSSAPAEAIGA